MVDRLHCVSRWAHPHRRTTTPFGLLALLAASIPFAAAPSAAALQTPPAPSPRAPSPAEIAADPALRVTITRTAYGVPHVQAEDLEAGGFGMAWVQMEDYGPRVVRGLLSARGEMGRHFGADSVGGDFGARRTHRLAVEAFPELDPAAAAVYRGFARGVNRYVAAHSDDFGPDLVPGGVPTFEGGDVLARDVVGFGSAGAFERRLEDRGVDAVTVPFERDASGDRDGSRSRDAWDDGDGLDDRDVGRGASVPEGSTPLRYRPDPGSNAWALAPSRTTSGHAILLRNPHLSWTAGYYEAHLTVPGILDFYGDFRVGGPFGIVGGFNRYLGFATTNNGPDPEEVYALAADPARSDHVRLDGRSVPLTIDTVEVEVRQEDGTLETRTRTLNPKFYEALLDHGYEGVRQIESQVTNTLGWSATTGKVQPWVYKNIAETFVLDAEMRQRLADLNPKASAKLANRLIEATERAYWQPDNETWEALCAASEELEDRVEGIDTVGVAA